MVFYQKIIILLGIFASISFVNIVHAVSFDCNKAKTLVEKTICSEPELSRLDDELAYVYRAALKKVADPKTLKRQQFKWLSVRNKCRTGSCLKSVYQTQVELLTQKKDRSHKGKINPIGKYKRKGNTASIDITALPNGNFYVSGEAVLVINAEMGNVRTGTLEGAFPLEGKTLYYNKLEGDEYGCKVKITFFNSGLEVSEDNRQCGGLGVSFDGVYARTMGR